MLHIYKAFCKIKFKILIPWELASKSNIEVFVSNIS